MTTSFTTTESHPGIHRTVVTSATSLTLTLCTIWQSSASNQTLFIILDTTSQLLFVHILSKVHFKLF